MGRIIRTFERNEQKYLVTEQQMQDLLPVLLQYMNWDPYCIDGKEYALYNVYYDTDTDSVIRHSLSKPYYKEKLRMRAYFIPKTPEDTVFLEIKKKIGGVGSKRRVTLGYGEAKAFLETGIPPEGQDALEHQILRELAYYLKINPPRPAAFIRSMRTALFGKDDPEFRLTFDRDILTRRENPTFEGGTDGEDLLPPGYRVMEVKIGRAYPMWLARELSRRRIFKVSYSKYGTEFKHYTADRLAHQDTRRYNLKHF